jgi:hypothetical protein
LGSSIPALHDYGEMVCGNCMHKHAFLWQYKKELADDKDQINTEACNGTMENGVNPNEIKIEDIRNNTVKTEERGKFILCVLLYQIICIIKVNSYVHHLSVCRVLCLIVT